MANKTILSTIFLLLFAKIVAADVFESILDSGISCNKKCRNASASHSLEKSTFEESCDRGCRLFSMMEFMWDDINRITEVCWVACQEAYPKTEQTDACKLGCESQKPFDLNHILKNDPWENRNQLHMLEPFYYVHRMYSNIFSNVLRQGTFSWTVLVSDSSGTMVVKSPQFIVANNLMETADEKSSDVSNPNDYLDVIIEPEDNSALPFVKNSAFTAIGDDDIISLTARDIDTKKNMAATPKEAWDWLSCVAKKTGLSQLVLSLLLLMCTLIMIWLCLSAAMTGPVQTIITKSKNLSINGDEEVIKELLACGIKPLYPQNCPALNEFPVKLTVHRI